MPETKNYKPSDWFLRRHSYGPEEKHQGMTEPDEQIITSDTGFGTDIIRNNELLEKLVDLQTHNNVTEHDIDISDSVYYSLAPGEAAEVSYNVPSNYVMLLRNFSTTLTGDTTYYVYLDDEVFQYIPDMDFPGMGIAISPDVLFKMYTLNTYASTQYYITSISATLRRSVNWKYPTYSYKKPV